MHFTKDSDNEWMRELVEHEVVRKGLDGLATVEGEDLFEHLLKNAERLPIEPWLEWLTSIRGLHRLATLKADADWIGSFGFSPVQRLGFVSARVFPCFGSSGSWICAGLKKDPAVLNPLEIEFGAPMVVIAPTPVELVDVHRYYR
jgi:hypothetical protein